MIINTVGELKRFIDKLDNNTKIRISEGIYQYPIKASTAFTVVESDTSHTVVSVELESYKNS